MAALVTSDLDYEFALAADGDLRVVEDEDCYRQQLLCMLSTEPPERVMRPTWGVGPTRFLGEPVNEDMAAEMEMSITETLAVDGRFEAELSVVADKDNNRYLVTGFFRIAAVKGDISFYLYSES